MAAGSLLNNSSTSLSSHTLSRQQQSFAESKTFFAVLQVCKEGRVAMVWWRREETRVQEVVGSNPSTGFWMDIVTH